MKETVYACEYQCLPNGPRCNTIFLSEKERDSFIESGRRIFPEFRHECWQYERERLERLTPGNALPSGTINDNAKYNFENRCCRNI